MERHFNGVDTLARATENAKERTPVMKRWPCSEIPSEQTRTSTNTAPHARYAFHRRAASASKQEKTAKAII